MSRRRILFVCTANICRSPTAEGVARALAEKKGLGDNLQFDSAGTHDYHVGEAPDPRTIKAAANRGYDLTKLKARRVTSYDFILYDLVLALDRGHLEELQRACPAAQRHKIGLLMDFSERYDEDEVPDPYYGNAQGFERVLDLIEDATASLIAELSAT